MLKRYLSLPNLSAISYKTTLESADPLGVWWFSALAVFVQVFLYRPPAADRYTKIRRQKVRFLSLCPLRLVFFVDLGATYCKTNGDHTFSQTHLQEASRPGGYDADLNDYTVA